MNILFDLDGTLIDSKVRIFNLFCDLSKQTLLDFDQYWNLKRSMVNHRRILTEYLHFTDKKIRVFENEWMGLIESEEYLLMDRSFLFTESVLGALIHKNCTLHLITSRQDRTAVIRQLIRLGLLSYFTKVLVTEAIKTKFELILESGIKLTKNDMFVGDTGVDIETAKLLGVRSHAVLSGFRNESILKQYKPDFIETDIQAIVNYV